MRGNFSCGVAVITLCGTGGIGWCDGGCFANSEANILLRSLNLLPPVDGPDDET